MFADSPGASGMSKRSIGIDLGGTKMRGGIIDPGGEVEFVQLEQTPSTTEEVVETMCSLIEKALGSGGTEISSVGIGAAGLVDVTAGIVRYAPNLVYREVPLTEIVQTRFGLSVVLDNDATCAGYAEFLIGAGRGFQDIVMVTLGTGIGGGFIFGGSLYRGAHGFAAEIGHMVLDPLGPVCGCGQRGCWERLASGTTLGEWARQAAEAPGGEAICRAAADISSIRGEDAVAAANLGDPVANSLIDELGCNLGKGLANLANILDPQVFVIGGGLATLGERLLVPAREELARSIEGNGYRPEVLVVPAMLGDEAGMIGAGLLAGSMASE